MIPGPNENSFHIASLIEKHLQNRLSPAEQEEIDNWLLMDEANRLLFDKLTNERYLAGELKFFENISVEKGLQKVASKTWQRSGVRSLTSSQRPWWLALSAAAAIFVVVLYVTNQYSGNSETSKEIAAKNADTTDVLPGGLKAVLQLADGSSVILDTAASGELTNQGGVKVIKVDGKLSYKSTGPAGEVLYNTIRTPRGGKFQLVLADGSVVWLNASSSLRFPTTFTGSERKVELTGEGYFEITHQAKRPFKVQIEGKQEVEVLGTHFNINAYGDEPVVKTTLLEGKVKVTAGMRSQFLSPGEQASLQGTVLSLNKNIDTKAVMGWKDGLFIMNSADIPTVIRQIARWYDLEVEYEGAVPSGHISGTVPMNMKLSEVVKVLELSGIKFRLEGRKMTIRP